MAESGQFGKLFRQRRKALGLSLRDFCRRHGFEQAYVSRLERGQKQPPKSQDKLIAYANALRFVEDSGERQEFMTQAAVESGIIPEQVRSDPRVSAAIRTAGARRSFGHALWCHARDLDDWAENPDARYALPQLVRRLIHAIAQDVEEVEFPAYEGVDQKGWDGVLKVRQNGLLYVPDGESGWELSCRKDAKEKADEDLANREKNVCGLPPADTTFVFLTPRKWSGKAQWCAYAKATKRWKDVRVYDAHDVEQWLELAPGVDAWLAARLGKPVSGVECLDSHWERLADLGTRFGVRLRPEVFLASRETQRVRLAEWLDGPPRPLLLDGRSPSEAKDFVATCIQTLKDDKRDTALARALIVRDTYSWRALVESKYPLILLADPILDSQPEDVAHATRNNHRVVLLNASSRAGSVQSIQLSRVRSDALYRELVGCGISREEAERLALDSGGSLSVLKRTLAPGCPPKWAQNPDPLLPSFLLLGAWDGANDADRKTLAMLTGRAYEEVMVSAVSLLGQEDSPLLKSRDQWGLVSHEDAWNSLRDKLDDELPKRFEDVAVSVLSEDDPLFDLPPSASILERWGIQDSGIPARASNRLRTGLITSVAYLGNRAQTSRTASGIVTRVLGPTGWKRWASLSRSLPTLAEAAPESFLEAATRMPPDPRTGLLRLFESDDGASVFGSPHAGLIEALRILAWNPDQFTRTVLLLTQLWECAKADRTRATLMDALFAIFHFARPATAASGETRRKLLLSVLPIEAPTAAWRLQIILVSESRTQIPNDCRPQWRDWAEAVEQIRSEAGYRDDYDACVRHLLATAGQNANHWEPLLANMWQFSEELRLNTVEAIEKLDPLIVDSEHRVQLAEILRNTVAHHRDLSSTFRRILPKVLLDRLAAVQERFEPEDLPSRHAWLFAPEPPIGETIGEELIATLARERKLREEAVGEVFASDGIEGVKELARKAVNPGRVGLALGRSALLTTDDSVLPSLLTSEEKPIREFAADYALGRFKTAGYDWLRGLPFATWTEEQTGTMLANLAWDDWTKELWDFVDGMGDTVRATFWRKTPRMRCRTATSLEYAVQHLLAADRPFVAVETIAHETHNANQLPFSLLMDVFGKAVEVSAVCQPESHEEKEIRRWSLSRLISQLESRDRDFTAEQKKRLYSLELTCLPLLGDMSSVPRGIVTALSENPAEFAEIIRQTYSPVKALEEEEASTRERARQGLHILISWAHEGALPGMRPDRTIDYDALLGWITEARDLCKKSGHLDLCDSRIGEALGTLACKVGEENGLWPCEAVRDVIDDVKSDSFDSGFETGEFNHFGGSGHGGCLPVEQEWRQRANDLRKWADSLDPEWSRSAKLLRNMATQYEGMANDMVRRAEEDM